MRFSLESQRLIKLVAKMAHGLRAPTSCLKNVNVFDCHWFSRELVIPYVRLLWTSTIGILPLAWFWNLIKRTLLETILEEGLKEEIGEYLSLFFGDLAYSAVLKLCTTAPWFAAKSLQGHSRTQLLFLYHYKIKYKKSCFNDIVLIALVENDTEWVFHECLLKNKTILMMWVGMYWW